MLTGDCTAWRLAFNGGLLAAAVVAGAVIPDAFDELPSTYTVARAALGGLLVGVGASMGNGCTSGHGICGNARLSPRSLAYTLVFMASGAAAATLSSTSQALGVADVPAPLVMYPAGGVLGQGIKLLAASAAAVAALVALANAAGRPGGRAVGLLSEAVCGALFALGLVYTGMVRPAKVAAFLSPGSTSWDPTLAFVMGGALAVSLPAFQWAKRARGSRAQQGEGVGAGGCAGPLCGDAFCDPAATGIDKRLLLGGLLFGAGWGVSGMCPGPALVSLAGPLKLTPQVAAYVGSMVAGMALECASCGNLAAPKGKGE